MYKLEFIRLINGDKPVKYYPINHNARLLLFIRNRKSLFLRDIISLINRDFKIVAEAMRYKGEGKS